MTQATPVFQEDVTQQVDVVLQDKLEKSNITEQSLSALKAELADIAAIKVEDKKSLALVQGGISKAVNVRNNIVRICKKGREAAIMEQRAWISKEKELVGVVEAMEKPLVALKEAYVAEQERIEREKLEARERVIRARFTALEGFGFTRRTAMAGGDDLYTNGDTTLAIAYVSAAEDTVWDNILNGIEMAWNEENERKAAAEEARRQEEERVKKEAAELEARRKELEAREAAMNARINEARRAQLIAAGGIGQIDMPMEADLSKMDEAEFGLLLVRVAENEVSRKEQKAKEQEVAAREQLIASRVKALKEAGWEQLDGAACLQLAVPEYDLPILIDPADDGFDFDAAVMTAQAELARRKAAQEEEEARKKLRSHRYGKMTDAGYNSECGDKCFFTMAFGAEQRPQSIEHGACYALSEQDFDGWISKALVEKNRRKAAELQAAKEKGAKEEHERIMQEAKEAREKEEDRQRRMNDAQRWEEWCKAVEKSAPRMASEIGKHAIARVVEGMKKMTPGLLVDLNK